MQNFEHRNQKVSMSTGDFRNLLGDIQRNNSANTKFLDEYDKNAEGGVTLFQSVLTCACEACEKVRGRIADHVQTNYGTNMDQWRGIAPAVEAYTPVDAPAPQATAPKKETTKMATSSSPSVKDVIRASMLAGAKQAAVGAAQRQSIAAIERLAGAHYPEFLKTDVGRKALEVAIPTLILIALDYDINNRVPRKDLVRAGANMALTEATRDGVDKVITAALEFIIPLAEAYVTAAEAGAAEIADQTSFEEFIERTNAGRDGAAIRDAVEVGAASKHL